MRVLPREHGATVIWVASLVLALGTLRAMPSVAGLAAFALGSALVLLFVAQATGGSVAVLRMERDPVLLPAFSGLLTLIVPFGHYAMAGALPVQTLAVWVLFLTYTTGTVVITRVGVRAILRCATPALAPAASLLAAVLLLEIALLAAFGWLTIMSAFVLVHLFLYVLAAWSLSQRQDTNRGRVVRKVGLAQSVTLIAVAATLAVARL